jgi:hypothetical protein
VSTQGRTRNEVQKEEGQWEKGLQIHSTHPQVIKALLLVGGTAQHAGIQIPTDNERRERGATMGRCKPDRVTAISKKTKNSQCNITNPDISTTVQPILRHTSPQPMRRSPARGPKK